MHQERDGEEDRKPGGKTRVKRDMESVGLKDEDAWTRQSVRMIFNTIPPDSGDLR